MSKRSASSSRLAVDVDKALIKALVEAWGPPGYEYKVSALIQSLVGDLVDDMRIDAAGNLICQMGTAGGKKVMIAAHMDEIGCIVHHIDRDGYARLSMIGYLIPNTLHGNRVLFENGVVGTVGIEHPFDLTHVPKLADCYIDFSTGKDSFADIAVGSVGALLRDMTERGDRLISKSMDDRIGCAVAIMAMRRIKQLGSPHELYFVFTTQEEVGVRGARVSAQGLAPDIAFALDVTSTGDVPKAEKANVKLGHGAAIKIRDAGHITPPKLKDLMIKRAEEAAIPYQLEILDLGSTDAMAIQQTGSGVPSGVISIPCRNVHTTSETVDINDVAASVDLLATILSQPIEF